MADPPSGIISKALRFGSSLLFLCLLFVKSSEEREWEVC